MDKTVQLTRTEFENLLKARFELIMVKDVLLNQASLSWNEKYLIWSDETTSALLHYIMGDDYDKKIEEMTKEDGE